MAFNTLAFEHAMHPEAVKSGFLNDHERKIQSGASLGLALQLGKSGQHSGNVAGGKRELREFLPGSWRQRGDQPFRLTEFQRDENRAKINANSGRRFGTMGCNGHACLQSSFLARTVCQSAARCSPPHGISWKGLRWPLVRQHARSR